MCEKDFYQIKNECFIASVTSADDEFDFGDIEKNFYHSGTQTHVELYYSDIINKYFYLMNNGNAVNFIDNAVLGPYIYLVQSEILAAAIKIVKEETLHGLKSMTKKERQIVAIQWLQYFAEEGL